METTLYTFVPAPPHSEKWRRKGLGGRQIVEN